MKNFIKRSLAIALMCAVTMANTSFNMLSADAALSEYKSWKQGDSRWGSIHLGSSGQTLSRIGCAVTSMAILMVHSGSVTDDSFDPGTLCNYLSANGGFDGYGNIRWGVATGMAGSFTFQGGGTLSGSQSAKASEIKSYLDSGYYVAVSVKYGGHWVAVDYVSDNGTVYMIDPARGTNTDLFSVYSASGVGQVRLFKGANSTSSNVNNKPAETTVKETSAPAVTTAVSENVPAETTTTAEETNVTYSEGRYTTTDVLNIRSNASISSDIIGKLPCNTSVFAYEIKDGWGKIAYNGVEGWVSLKYTEYGGVVPFYTTGLYSTVADLNLRTYADITSASQLVIPVKTTLPVTEIKDSWGKVEYNGVTGWICMDYTAYDGEIPEQQPEITEPTITETTKPAVTEETKPVNTWGTKPVVTEETVTETSSKLGTYLTFDQVNFRKDASSSSELIGRISGYAKVNVTEIKDNWGKVTFNGNTGWICLDYAKPCEIKLTGDINGDGYITINDYNLLRQEIINNRTFTKAEISVADLNGDGIVDISDAELLEKKIG